MLKYRVTAFIWKLSEAAAPSCLGYERLAGMENGDGAFGSLWQGWEGWRLPWKSTCGTETIPSLTVEDLPGFWGWLLL